jgi:hypothetical protein
MENLTAIVKGFCPTQLGTISKTERSIDIQEAKIESSANLPEEQRPLLPGDAEFELHREADTPLHDHNFPDHVKSAWQTTKT